MKTILSKVVASVCLAGALALWALPAGAQASDAKEKPGLYTYVSNWTIPRARWADMDKDSVSTAKVLDRAVAGGTIVAYGNSTNLVHTPKGPTHSGWWCATSMAGALNVLDGFYKSGSTVTPVFSSATEHWDNLYVSRFYNWHPGVVKGGYVHGATYTLKPDAPNDAVEILAKGLLVPFLEKLVADGTVVAYQIAEENVHTDDPNMFYLFFITPTAEGLDKVNAALRESIGSQPLAVRGFGSMVDFTPHRDSLGRVDASFK
jgi:hypothetical protein